MVKIKVKSTHINQSLPHPPTHWLCYGYFMHVDMQICPQQKQTEGTYRDLLVPLNNRTV